jgi:hypothetical protein
VNLLAAWIASVHIEQLQICEPGGDFECSFSKQQ